VTFATVLAFLLEMESKRTKLPSSSLSDSTRWKAGERLRESILFRESSGVEALEPDVGVREPSARRGTERSVAARGLFCAAAVAAGFFNEVGWEEAATFSILMFGAFRPFLPQKDMNRNKCK
jgi:hypothetical protein